MSEIHGDMIGYIEKDITHIEIVMINAISGITMMQITIIMIISDGMIDSDMTMVITRAGTKTKKTMIEVMKVTTVTMIIEIEKNQLYVQQGMYKLIGELLCLTKRI